MNLIEPGVSDRFHCTKMRPHVSIIALSHRFPYIVVSPIMWHSFTSYITSSETNYAYKQHAIYLHEPVVIIVWYMK